MEYITKNGVKVTVEGDKLYANDKVPIKVAIGANHIHGNQTGGLLSSFNGSFSKELICIEDGFGDGVKTRIGNIKDAYELLKSKINNIDIADIYTTSNAVLETVDEFFGGISNIETRMDYYQEGLDENNEISNLKGTGAAMCVERAALSQNLLTSLGINSFFKTSGIIKNNEKEVHSYNLIENKGQYYIFDTSMPNLINGEINPLIAEIDEETFRLLSYPLHDSGISVTTSHYSPYQDKDITITYDDGRPKEIEVKALGEKKQSTYNEQTTSSKSTK